MSTTIDQRVVEMRFDNAQFERNISQSTESLEKLKSALKLDNAAENFNAIEKAAKGLNLSSITETVQSVSHSFSALESVANGVFQRLGWNIAGSVQKWISELNKFSLFGQAGLGWTKYAELTESTQTIVAAGYAMKDVEAALERLNWYTDETSYNFTDMANNIGKFTAQGIDLEVAATAMQGISNWAARSGQHVAEAGRAMYNLSQSLAVGSVKLMDWKSIENANMATKEFKETAIETALAMGTLTKGYDGVIRTANKAAKEVTAASFSSTLSEAWFTSDVLLKTLEKYGAATNELYEIGGKTGLTATQMLMAMESYQKGTNEWQKIFEKNGEGYTSVEQFGEMLAHLGREENKLGLESFRMAQEALTFKQAMDSVVDAASTSWMNVFNKLFGTFEDAKGLWTNVANDFYDIFVEPVNDMLAFVTKNFDSGVTQIEALVSGAGVDIKDFEKTVLDLADASGISSKKIREDIESGKRSLYDMFTNPSYIKYGWDSNLINQAVEKLTGGTVGQVKDATAVVQEYADLVNSVIRGNYGNGAARVKALTDAGYEYEKVQGLVNKVINGGTVALDDFSEAELQAMGLTEDTIKQLNDLFNTETDAGKAYAEALKLVNHRSNRDLLAEGIHKSLEGIANIGFIVRKVIGQIFDSPATSFISKIVSGFNEIAVKFADFTNSIYENEDLLKSVSDVIDGIFGVIGSGFGVVKSFFSAVWSRVKSLLSLFMTVDVSSILNRVSKSLKTVSDRISTFAAKVRESTVIKSIVDAIAGAIYYIYTNITNLFDYIDEHLPKGTSLFDRLGKAVSNLWEKFKNNKFVKKYLGWLIDGAEKLVQELPEAFETVKTALSGFFDYLDEKTEGGTNIFGGMISMLGDLKTAVLGLFDFNNIDLKTFIENNAPNFFKGAWENLSGGISAFLSQGGEDAQWFGKALGTATTGLLTFKDAVEGSFWRIRSKAFGFADKVGDLLEPLQNLDVSQITSITALGALSGGFLKIANGFNKFGVAAENISKPFLEIKNILSEVKGIAQAVKAEVKANTFRTIAFGVAMIAASIVVLLGAIYLLSKNVKNINELIPGLIAVGALMAFIAAFFAAISAINARFGGISNVVGVAATLISMSLSVILLVAALKMLTKIKADLDWGIMLKFGVLIAGLSLFIKNLDGVGLGKAIGLMLSLGAVVAFMVGIALSIWVLDRVLGNLRNPGKTIGVIALFIISLAGLSSMSSILDWKAVASLVTIPLAILMFGHALEGLAAIKWDEINKHIVAISVTIIALIGIFFIINAISSLSPGGGSWKAGAGVLGIALSLLIIAKAVQMIMKIPPNATDPDRLGKVLGGLLVALVAMSLLAGYMSSATGGQNAVQVGVSMIALAFAILVVAGAIILLSTIDPNEVMNGANALLWVFLGIAAVVYASQKAQPAVGTILSLAAMLIVLVLAFAAMQNISTGNLVKAGVAIAAMLAAIGLFMYFATQTSGGKEDFLSLLGGVLIIAAIAGALIAVANLAKDVDVLTLLGIAAAISLIAIAFGGMFALIGHFGQGATLPLLALAAVFVGLGAGLWLAAKGIQGFMAAFGSLDLSQVEALGIKIGALVPSMISGFLIGLFHAIPQIGMGLYTAFKSGLSYLSLVWEDVKTYATDLWSKFVEGIKEIDWGDLAEAIWEKITGALGWAWGKIQDFATLLNNTNPKFIADPITTYAKHTGIETDAIAGTIQSGVSSKIANEGFITPEAVRSGIAASKEAAAASGGELADAAINGEGGFKPTFMTDLSNALGGDGMLDLTTLLGSEGGVFDFTSIGNFSADSFNTTLSNTISGFDFNATGQEVGDGLSTGTEQAASKERFMNIARNALAGIAAIFTRDAGIQYGADLGDGLAIGTEMSLSINSPSRRYYEIGEYCVKGLVNAVQHLSGTAANAGYDLGTSVLTATATSLAGMYSILEGDEMIMPSVGLVGSSSLYQNGLRTGGLNGGSYRYTSPSGNFRSGSASSVTTNSPVFNIYQQPGEDPEALARIINRELGRMYVR